MFAEFKNDLNTGGRIEYVWLFSIVGIFILFLACINFVNLSTANAQSRAREIGIRKTIGSSRKQLVWQFFSETLLIVSFSFVIALVLILFALPLFNQLSDKQLSIEWTNPYFWAYNLIFWPDHSWGSRNISFYVFFSFPFSRLKCSVSGTIRVGRAAILQRKSFVVLQFTVSIILIIKELLL